MRTTIQDVARHAGVSVATVDRVLNGRPMVRSRTVDKVRDAMKALNYRPDIFAANLSRKRVYRFLFLLPQRRSSFMKQLTADVALAAEHFRPGRIEIETRFFEDFNGPALAATLDAVSPADHDGIAVYSLDLPGVQPALNRCVERGVKVVTLVSDLPASARAHFIGPDNVVAGRLAGRLIGRFTAGRRGNVAFIAGSMTLRDHVERHLGCEQVLRAEFPDAKLLPVVEGYDDTERTATVTRSLFDRFDAPDLMAIYSMGAGNQGLIRVMERIPRGKPVVIAHELTEHTRRALVNGTIDALLSQDTKQEVRAAVRVLQALSDNEEVEFNMERVRLDLFFPDNLP
ncbi:MAG: LacI family DNA-binding transcriptional regulator [Methylobacteriaceae bacterium]|jgi:LacI family transcriptional regulator|nr:LacI family DNA-binding transcriptional regulator [Methylobacteriaceae bacterium]